MLQGPGSDLDLGILISPMRCRFSGPFESGSWEQKGKAVRSPSLTKLYLFTIAILAPNTQYSLGLF